MRKLLENLGDKEMEQVLEKRANVSFLKIKDGDVVVARRLKVTLKGVWWNTAKEMDTLSWKSPMGLVIGGLLGLSPAVKTCRPKISFGRITPPNN